MSAAVDSSVTFSGFEESMTKRPTFDDHHRFAFAFHRFSLLREKNLLTDAVILSSDDKRWRNHIKADRAFFILYRAKIYKYFFYRSRSRCYYFVLTNFIDLN